MKWQQAKPNPFVKINKQTMYFNEVMEDFKLSQLFNTAADSVSG
jgi:hypothetical protein